MQMRVLISWWSRSYRRGNAGGKGEIGEWCRRKERGKEQGEGSERGWRLESAATFTHEISCLKEDFSVCGP